MHLCQQHEAAAAAAICCGCPLVCVKSAAAAAAICCGCPLVCVKSAAARCPTLHCPPSSRPPGLSPPHAAVVPALNGVRLLLIGNGIVKDERAVMAMSRSGDPAELLR